MKTWQPKGISEAEKVAVTAACQRFIDEVLIRLRHKMQKLSNDAAFERLNNWLFPSKIAGQAGSPLVYDAVVLKPRFLSVIRPTQFNYPIDIHGKWRGTRYRFIQRYRSGFPDRINEEFDSLFAAMDWIARDRFDIQWHRHTGVWHCLYRGLSLADALNAIETDPVLYPL